MWSQKVAHVGAAAASNSDHASHTASAVTRSSSRAKETASSGQLHTQNQSHTDLTNTSTYAAPAAAKDHTAEIEKLERQMKSHGKECDRIRGLHKRKEHEIKEARANVSFLMSIISREIKVAEKHKGSEREQAIQNKKSAEAILEVYNKHVKTLQDEESELVKRGTAQFEEGEKTLRLIERLEDHSQTQRAGMWSGPLRNDVLRGV